MKRLLVVIVILSAIAYNSLDNAGNAIKAKKLNTLEITQKI